MAGKAQVTLASASIDSAAKTDFCAFLALDCLSPLVISTTDPQALAALKSAHASLHTDWAADRNARLYGDTQYAYTYSDAWLSDRAALLGAVIQRNESDRSGILPGSQNLHYQDVDSGTDVLVGAGSAQRTQVLFGKANEVAQFLRLIRRRLALQTIH